MEKSKQTTSWIDQVINTWTTKGIKLQVGISIDKIYEIELLISFKFPQDFIELYSKVNGFQDFEWNENMFSLWSLDRILKENQENGNTNFIGFCDFLINSHSIGFLKSNKGIFKSHNKTTAIGNTFKEVIELINSNSALIY